MHDGCTGAGNTGDDVLQKVRQMGFSRMPMPVPLRIGCGICGGSFEMARFEDACDKCGAVHAVTPCHAGDPEAVLVSSEKRPAGL